MNIRRMRTAVARDIPEVRVRHFFIISVITTHQRDDTDDTERYSLLRFHYYYNNIRMYNKCTS